MLICFWSGVWMLWLLAVLYFGLFWSNFYGLISISSIILLNFILLARSWFSSRGCCVCGREVGVYVIFWLFGSLKGLIDCFSSALVRKKNCFGLIGGSHRWVWLVCFISFWKWITFHLLLCLPHWGLSLYRIRRLLSVWVVV